MDVNCIEPIVVRTNFIVQSRYGLINTIPSIVRFDETSNMCDRNKNSYGSDNALHRQHLFYKERGRNRTDLPAL